MLTAVASTNPSLQIACWDVSGAHFCSPATRDIWVALPDEYQQGVDPSNPLVGKLVMSFYGTRDAGHNWQHAFSAVLVGAGFLQGKASDALFFHPGREIRLEVHGDDFFVVANSKGVDFMQALFDKHWKTRRVGLLDSPGTSMRILNRLLSRTNAGYELEADPRHVAIAANELGLQTAKGVASPLAKYSSQEESDMKHVVLNASEATLYRSCTMRLAYCSSDRGDLQYAIKVLSTDMHSPTCLSMQNLVHVVRYCISHPRLVIMYLWQPLPKFIDTEADSDFAGDRVTRKSTSGGVVVFGHSLIKSWSATQKVIALSTGEAEFYGSLKAASTSLGLQSLFCDIGIIVGVRLWTDANANKGLIEKKGLGRAKHIATQYLWIQDVVAKKLLSIGKIGTLKNRSDMMTKVLTEVRMQELLRLMHCEFRDGKHCLALQAK